MLGAFLGIVITLLIITTNAVSAVCDLIQVLKPNDALLLYVNPTGEAKATTSKLEMHWRCVMFAGVCNIYCNVWTDWLFR